MTIQQIHYDFDLKIDKVSSLAKPYFNAFEKDWLLNEAQNVIVKQRYGGTNPKRTSLDQTQKRMDDLSTLHIKYPDQGPLTPVEDLGVLRVDLEDLKYDYLFMTRAYAKVNDPKCGIIDVNLYTIETDDLNEALQDPFSKSSVENGILYNLGRKADSNTSSMYIYPQGMDITGVVIEYIKRPLRMSLGGYTNIDLSAAVETQCELPDHMHEELVDIAVKIASGIIEHPTYNQMKAQKVFEHE